MAFNLKKFFINTFNPQSGEVVVILYDKPHSDCPHKDNAAWKGRRQMARSWEKILKDLGLSMGFQVFSAFYLATGQNNGNLPHPCYVNKLKTVVNMDWFLRSASIILSMPEFSATAPLKAYVKDSKYLRLGSMPGLTKIMLNTGLAADYGEIKRRCAAIKPLMQKAASASVEFSTGHKMHFDLRFNEAHSDDGDLREGGKSANLPAGEVFKVPFEGDKTELSGTRGEIPIIEDGALHVLQVKNNKIVGCTKDGVAVDLDKLFGNNDPACRNIAEFAIGVNDGAKITGSILQDEKALGCHWARGRSEHLGGSVGPAQFRDPKNIIHQDYVYPIAGAGITVREVILYYFPVTDSRILIAVIHGGKFLI